MLPLQPLSRWRKRLLLTVFAALGIVLCFWSGRLSVTPLQALELTGARVKLEDGRLLRRDNNEPFTGFLIERYEDGKLKSRSAISNGLMHGLSEGWHTNGTLQISEPFLNGVSHGTRVKWHPNGQKLSEATVVHGQLHGPFRRWHENGKLAEEMVLKSGAPDGKAVSYFPSGYIQAETTLSNGVLVHQAHWKDGERASLQ